jgi:plastocyanin
MAAIALLASSCGGNDRSFDPSGTGGGAGRGTLNERVPLVELSDGTRAADHGELRVTGSTAEVRMGEFFFEPTVLSAPAGTRLTLRLRNTGSNVHIFSMQPQDVNVTVAEGREETVEVTVPQDGAVTFECTIHLPAFMRGELRAG